MTVNYVIQYRGADRVSKVCDELAGCFSYYASISDAIKHHQFVEMLVIPYDSRANSLDYLGNRFAVISREQLIEMGFANKL